MEQTLTTEMESVLNKLALQMTDIVNNNSDTRIKNLEVVSANLNKKIVYSVYAIMKSFSIENGETIKTLLLENKENVSSTKIDSVVTQLTKLVSENLEADFLDTLGRHRNQIDAYIFPHRGSEAGWFYFWSFRPSRSGFPRYIFARPETWYESIYRSFRSRRTSL